MEKRAVKSIPVNWASVFGVNQLTISPGSTSFTNFSLTSSINATPGNYTFTNTAKNDARPAFSGSANATYTVV